MAKIMGVHTSGAVGSIISWPGGAQPPRTLQCDAASYLVADFPALFAVIGYTYGGSGPNFNVPDRRGLAEIGIGGNTAGRTGNVINGNSLGAVAGEEIHTLSVTEMPTHNHSASGSSTHDHKSYVGAGHGASLPVGGTIYIGDSNGSGTINNNPRTSMDTVGVSVTVNNNGSNGPHNNLQPTVVTNKVICYN